MRNNRIHSLTDFDAQGLNELWLWLKTQLPRDVDRGGGGIQWEDIGAACGEVGHLGVPIDSAYKIPGAGLVYWYRLGETGPFPTGAVSTPNFALDSSGNNHHLEATNKNNGGTGAPVTWITDPTTTFLPAMGVTGGLTGGNANDGGVRFRFNQFQWTSWDYHLCLTNGTVHIEEPLLTGSSGIGGGSTFAAWVAFVPPTDPDVTSNVAPSTIDTIGPRKIVSTKEHVFGISTTGTSLGFDPHDGTLHYEVFNSGGSGTGFTWVSSFGFVPNKWYHFASSIVKLASNSFRRRVYVNTNVLFDQTGADSVVGLATPGVALSLGGGWDDDLRFSHGAGQLDEVAHWASCLTDSQIYDLWNARVLNTGDSWYAPS